MSPLRNVAPEALHRQGWVILRGVLTRRMIDDLIQLSRSEGFDDADDLLGPNMFDGADASRRASRRKARELDIQDPIVSAVIEHVKSHLGDVGLLTSEHVVSGASLLLAMSGAPEQGIHLDFVNDPDTYSELSDSGQVAYPVSIMFALEEDTRIVFGRPGAEEDIPVGGCAIWKGNHPHAGTHYLRDNVRFHLYMGYRGADGILVGPPRDDDDEALLLLEPDSQGPPPGAVYRRSASPAA